MIRKVQLADSKGISDIYNEYVVNSTVTFETEPVPEAAMRSRISEISSRFPYFVCELNGKIAGYCYAHQWKEKAAYKHTLETTVYISPQHQKAGIGGRLMSELIEECRRSGCLALIASITNDNEASKSLHLKLGFKQASLFEKVGVKFGQRLDVADYELLLEE